MEKIFEQFTVAILKFNKLVQKIKTYEMEEFGLKAIHVMCGYYLSEHPEGLTASELSKLTLEDKAAISRALIAMRKKGLVAYDPKTYNAEIVLTDEGRRFAAAVGEKAARAVEAGSANQTDEERIEFYKKLGAIVDNLTEYYYGNLTKGRERKSNGQNSTDE